MDIVISPEELKKRLDFAVSVFVFDLRNEDEFAGWRIEGRAGVTALNIPQIAFVGEEEKYFDRFPKGEQIVAVCAHGDSSFYSAELLRQQGFDAVSLKGGMDAWSELYETRKVNTAPDIYQIYRVARGCITHVIISEGEAVIIDAVRHLGPMMDILELYNARVAHVVDTHLQADHISGGPEIARKTGASYHVSPEDMSSAVLSYTPLRDGDVVAFGNSRGFASPGHTPGSTSLLLDGRFLFTGDTIMKTNIGRPDLGGKVEEWAGLLYDTLFNRYSEFSDELIILPSHAASVREQDMEGVVRITLGEARNKSELYQKRDYGEFLGFIKASLPESPERYQEIRKVNLGLTDPDEKKRKELEIGKNLCAMAKSQ